MFMYRQYLNKLNCEVPYTLFQLPSEMDVCLPKTPHSGTEDSTYR